MDWETYATVLLPAASAALYATVQASFLLTMRTRSKEAPIPRVRPWVSVLKPISGVDDALRENLESFAAIDYPAFEILFGVASSTDPSIPVVRAFLADHPELAGRLIITRPPSDEVYNPKVAQLLDLTRAARGSVIVVSDANTRVSPLYLRAMVSALFEPGVGLVSSVIVGRGERTLGAALDNAVLGAAVAPLVVASHALGVKPVTVGKSMAMRRADLERAGGWETVARVLAEDDVLGQTFDSLGYKVTLCLDPVENHVASASMRAARYLRTASFGSSLGSRVCENLVSAAWSAVPSAIH